MVRATRGERADVARCAQSGALLYVLHRGGAPASVAATADNETWFKAVDVRTGLRGYWWARARALVWPKF